MVHYELLERANGRELLGCIVHTEIVDAFEKQVRIQLLRLRTLHRISIAFGIVPTSQARELEECAAFQTPVQ